MKLIRKNANFLSVFMATLMLLIAVPYQTILAAMIPTEVINDTNKSQEARDFLNELISREDIQNYLTNQGIDPLEAKARIDSLSDSEAVMMAKQLEQLPAGGGAVGIIIGAALIVFLVLLATDILGYTDVFPFVKKHK
ncbi:MAG: hypothetical protein BV456_13280 [Thermoplasmata archaeon M8B2D]|nr:MAG: hypothetical protein BV456_13280 [Thermoplasmata archaeon M8B2D]